MTVTNGDTVTLACPARRLGTVEWTRGNETVCYNRSPGMNRCETDHVPASFKGRVELNDTDASLVLKDVRVNDTGTYQCRVKQKGTSRRKRQVLPTDPITTIHLKVCGGQSCGPKDGGDERGTAGPAAAGIIPVFVVVVVVIYRKRKTTCC